jgi:hypothetical protein
MSKLILEQALEHLLNKEEDAASELIHNYYVDIGRKVYEDIMADEVVDEADFDSDEALDDVEASVEEVEDELTEEGDDEEMPMDDEEAVDDMADDMGAEEPVDSDAADVADAMVDVEAALAKLKAEFEDMVGDDSADEEMPVADEEMPAEESVFSEDEEVEESTEETLEEEAKLKPVGNPDNGDKADQKKSPVAGKNPLGDRPSVKFGGSASGEGTISGTKPAAAPAAQDMGGTTEPNMSQVATPKNKG